MNQTTINPSINDPETKFIQDLLADYNDSKNTDQQVLSTLGLSMPPNLLTEDIPIWKEFLKVIISGYASNLFEKGYAQQLYQAFLETDKEEKRDKLNQLQLLLEESIQISETNQIVYTKEVVEGKIKKVLPLLSPQEQIDFLESVDLGVIPEELQTKLAMMNEPVITPEEAEAYAKYRLWNALYSRKRLDARNFNKPFTADEVQAVVESEDEPQAISSDVASPETKDMDPTLPKNYIPTPPPRVVRPPTPKIRRPQQAATLDQLLHANDNVDQN